MNPQIFRAQEHARYLIILVPGSAIKDSKILSSEDDETSKPEVINREAWLSRSKTHDYHSHRFELSRFRYNETDWIVKRGFINDSNLILETDMWSPVVTHHLKSLSVHLFWLVI